MSKCTFREWTLDQLDETFQLTQIFEHEVLNEWENWKTSISDYEKQHLTLLQKNLIMGGNAWNEVELENKFISPLIMLAQIDNLQFSYFLERELKGIIGEYELSGIVDGLIAMGFRNPHKPFFCLHEYKKAVDNSGNPDAQVLAAMLVARELNGNTKPVYGVFIIGSIWQFLVLDKQQYCLSKKYDASAFRNGQDDILAIFQMMKALREIIEQKWLNKDSKDD